MGTDIGSLCERLENIASTLQNLRPAPACGCAAKPGAMAADDTPAIVQARQLPEPGIPAQPNVTGQQAATPEVAFVDAFMAARRQRSAILEDDLLFDPAWSMVVDLYRAALRGQLLSVKSVAIGSGVPDTTALRYLRILEARGYVERFPDEADRRRVFVKLTKPTLDRITRYFSSMQAGELACIAAA